MLTVVYVDGPSSPSSSSSSASAAVRRLTSCGSWAGGRVWAKLRLRHVSVKSRTCRSRDTDGRRDTTHALSSHTDGLQCRGNNQSCRHSLSTAIKWGRTWAGGAWCWKSLANHHGYKMHGCVFQLCFSGLIPSVSSPFGAVNCVMQGGNEFRRVTSFWFRSPVYVVKHMCVMVELLVH